MVVAVRYMDYLKAIACFHVVTQGQLEQANKKIEELTQTQVNDRSLISIQGPEASVVVVALGANSTDGSGGVIYGLLQSDRLFSCCYTGSVGAGQQEED
jgi:hypothetical protein